MPSGEVPHKQRRGYRKPSIEIRPARLRKMTAAERKAGEAALARLFAAMLADEEFLTAERRRQARDQPPGPGG